MRSLLLLLSFSAIHLTDSCGIHHDANHNHDAPDPNVVLRRNLALRAENNKRPCASPKFAVTNVHVFDGWNLLPPRTVVIENGRIGHPHDRRDAIEIDGSGHTLMPGLIDSHAHPSNITHLQSLTKFGVTTAMVMACLNPLLCSSLRNHNGLADVVLGSFPVAAAGSIHGQMFGLNASTAMGNASQAPAWVDAQIANGADFIKLIAETPGLSQETLSATTFASHARGKPTIAHASDTTSIHQALVANATQIHHVPLDKPLDAPTAGRYHQQRTLAVPTLIMMLKTTLSIPHLNFSAPLHSTTTLHAAGVPILVGTDANDDAGAPGHPAFGASIHEEMNLLVSAEIPALEVLRGATGRAARAWGLHDRGVIEVGKRADLVVVLGDPTQNISATREIRKVWVGGVEVDDVWRV